MDHYCDTAKAFFNDSKFFSLHFGKACIIHWMTSPVYWRSYNSIPQLPTNQSYVKAATLPQPLTSTNLSSLLKWTTWPKCRCFRKQFKSTIKVLRNHTEEKCGWLHLLLVNYSFLLDVIGAILYIWQEIGHKFLLTLAILWETCKEIDAHYGMSGTPIWWSFRQIWFESAGIYRKRNVLVFSQGNL